MNIELVRKPDRKRLLMRPRRRREDNIKNNLEETGKCYRGKKHRRAVYFIYWILNYVSILNRKINTSTVSYVFNITKATGL